MGISLVRATTLYPMMLAMDKINVSSSKLLDEARIPQIDYCNPGDWISTERVLYLDSLVSRKGRVSSLAFFAAEAASIADMGEFGKHLLQSATLNETLDRYCDNQIYYRSSASCYLMRGQKFIWLCRQTRGYFQEGYEQLELYALAEMIRVVRLAAGPDWWPQSSLRLHGCSEAPITSTVSPISGQSPLLVLLKGRPISSDRSRLRRKEAGRCGGFVSQKHHGETNICSLAGNRASLRTVGHGRAGPPCHPV